MPAKVAAASVLLVLAIHLGTSATAAEVYRILDKGTGEPVSTAYISVSEEVRVWAPFRADARRCVATGTAQGRGDKIEVAMKETGEARGLFNDILSRPFVYVPGYCTDPGYSFQRGTWVGNATRSTDPPEHRILELAAKRSDLRWQRCAQTLDEEKALREIDKAILAEAEAVAAAAGPYERRLAAILARRDGEIPLDRDEIRRDFEIVDERFGKEPNWSIPNGTPVGTSSPIGGMVSYLPGESPPAVRLPQLRLHCRDTPCQFERRNARGITYLHELIADAHAERALMLLKAGADPNNAPYPGGPTGLDVLVRRLSDPVSPGRLAQVEAIVRALSEDGRATVDLASLESWLKRLEASASPDARLISIARILKSMPSRKKFVPSCPFRMEDVHFDLGIRTGGLAK